MRLGTRVVEIDTRTHTVVQEDGGTVRDAKLLLATGSSPRRLSLPGADAGADSVHYLRKLPDSEADVLSQMRCRVDSLRGEGLFVD